MFGEFIFPQLGKVASELLRGADKEMSEMLRGYDTTNTTIDWDLIKTADGYTVYADLPGIKKEDVQVYINEIGSLVISAKRSKPSEDLLNGCRRHGSFKAEVTLPKDADTNTCNSALDNGVLVVTLAHTTENVRKWVPVR